MTASEIVVCVLLTLMVAVQWLCCLGLLLMRNPYDRLHAIGPANLLPPLFIVAAAFVQSDVSQVGIKTILIALTLILTSPIVTHAIARAVRISEKGALQPGK